MVAVGEAAKKDSKISYMSFNEDRYRNEIGIFLTLAGIYLTADNTEEEIELGLGLPISLYRIRKEDIMQTYTNIEAEMEGEDMPKCTGPRLFGLKRLVLPGSHYFLKILRKICLASYIPAIDGALKYCIPS